LPLPTLRAIAVIPCCVQSRFGVAPKSGPFSKRAETNLAAA
jgi:hypothetical protein